MPDRWTTDDASQFVWLFGHPVGHSLSPLMQNAAFRHAGLALRYVARDIEPGGLGEAVEALRSPRAKGANVTLPHKQSVLRMLDDVDEDAATIGAVNTIVNDAGHLKGYNTDVGGFLGALMSVLPQGARGLKCLVIGAGGAARSVLAGLQREGAATVWVANRTRPRAEELCEAAGGWGATGCVPLGLEEIRLVVEDCSLIVNATSLGLPGSVKELPIDVDTLHSGQVVLDLAYSGDDTELVKAARGGGLVAVDGKEMLVQQAALSFRLWTGLDAPVDVMRGSLIGS